MAQDSDSALFGGMIDLGPVSPTFASILAEPQTYQPEPITGSPVHAETTVVSSAQGSDASSSSAPPSPAAAVQSLGLLAPRNAAHNQPDTSPIEELLTLIDWQSGDHHAPKRIRGAPEKSHEKHVEHEKRRRNELASAIEEIDSLIPNTALGSASAKRTKLATLQEAAEYFKRVQDMACVLVRENRRLAASLREQPAAASPAALQSGTGIQRQDVARLFVTTAFLVWIFVGVPTPWLSSSFGSVAFSSRTVLSLDGERGTSVIMAGLHLLGKVATKIAVFLTAFFVVWICTLVQEMPRIPADDLRAAEVLLTDAAQSVERNSNWVVAQVKHNQAMALLRKPLPSSLLGELMFFVVQFIRASLNLLVVGLWMERALVYILGRQEASALDSKGYMLGARLGPGGPLKSRPLRYFSCVLGAASGLNVINAPLRDKDELGHRIGLFLADMPARRAHFLVSSLLLSLAEAQLNPIRLNMAPEDVSDWTLLRMLESHVHQGKLEEALGYIMRLLPALPDGPAKVKAICSAGTVNFCLRRYREAFLMIQTAVSLGSTCNLMPVIAVRFLTGTILVALYKLGQKEEARALLSHYESMYTCMPDVRSNIMPNERHVLDVTKIILTDDDYPAVMLHTREMLSIVARHGLQRCFNLPYTLEIVLERLFGAIQLSNDAAEKTSRTPSEVFVLHQREEICEMCESVIDMLVRAAFWAPYTQPIVERAKGWLALLNRDRATASYHLNRALLEARRMDVPHQETFTIELMQKLGVPLLGDEAKAVGASECPSVTIKACVSAIFGGTTAAAASGAV